MAKSKDSEIAVLQNQVQVMTETVTRIEVKLDAFNNNFVSRSEFSEFKQRWFLSHTLASLAGAILSGVLVYVLTHRT